MLNPYLMAFGGSSLGLLIKDSFRLLSVQVHQSPSVLISLSR